MTTDLTIYGASGFTGRVIARQVVSLIMSGGSSSSGSRETFTFALAGRSKDKLHAVKRELCREFPEFAAALANNVSIVIASTEDEASLEAMAAGTQVVVAAVGPFRRHGLPVVAACARAGTCYVDISGEPEFIERAAADYDALAKENGALIVSACGMDSVPCDMGVVHATRVAESRGLVPTAMEAYLTMSTQDVPGVGSVIINYGTWDSLIHSFANIGALRALRAAHPAPRLEYASPGEDGQARFPKRGKMFRTPDGIPGSRAIHFMGADASVVRRSQIARQAAGNTPIRFGVFLTLPSLFATLMITVWAMFLGIAASFKLGRWFLLNYPRIATVGRISFDGPNPVTRAATTLTVDMHTKAAPSGTLSSSSSSAPITHIHTRYTLVDPGYEATAACIVQCAATILADRDSLPSGVTTTAGAFADSSLLDRLLDTPISASTISVSSPS